MSYKYWLCCGIGFQLTPYRAGKIEGLHILTILNTTYDMQTCTQGLPMDVSSQTLIAKPFHLKIFLKRVIAFCLIDVQYQ